MTEKQEIVTLLEEKVELLLQLEQISDSIYSLPIEELYTSMNKRQAMINKMEKIDERVELLCSGLEPSVQEAVKNRCEREGLSEEDREVYDKAMETRNIAQRVNRNSDGIREMIQLEQQKTRAEILKLNNSSSTVAGRYGQGIRTGTNKRILPGDKGTQI